VAEANHRPPRAPSARTPTAARLCELSGWEVGAGRLWAFGVGPGTRPTTGRVEPPRYLVVLVFGGCTRHEPPELQRRSSSCSTPRTATWSRSSSPASRTAAGTFTGTYPSRLARVRAVVVGGAWWQVSLDATPSVCLSAWSCGLCLVTVLPGATTLQFSMTH
jgi:hypothetical protein